MDFYKSNSNHSSTQKSQTSSNKSDYAFVNLKYYTSSSSNSPYDNLKKDKLSLSSSSQSPLQSPGTAAATSASSSSLSYQRKAQLLCAARSREASFSRKRRRHSREVRDNGEKKDPEIDFDPPSAKRQQRVPTIYQSEPSSIESTVYPSPVLDMFLNNIIAAKTPATETTAPTIEAATIKTKTLNDDNNDDKATPQSIENYDKHNIAKDVVDDNHNDHDEDDDDVDNDNITTSTEDSDNMHNDDDEIDGLCDEILNDTDDDDDDGDDDDNDHHVYDNSNNSDADNYNNNNNDDEIDCKNKTLTSSMCVDKKLSNQDIMDDEKNVKPTLLPIHAHFKSVEDYYNSSCMTPAAEIDSQRQCPLPALSWANAHDVWHAMCKSDEETSCLRDINMLDNHPGLQVRMRAILLDWLMEVCEVYKLHRETYYLAQDYLDRYLSVHKYVQKTHLQLIGITCLFMAAKVEEIYPPKIGEFAYVTDGACQENDILKHEILLLQALDWNISPITPMAWLGIYMQLNVSNRTPASFKNTTTSSSKSSTSTISSKYNKNGVDDAFIYPQFSGMEFVQTSQLLDLCSLDIGMANFSYSILAAAAISHTFNQETAVRCSGYNWQAIKTCADWMKPFFQVIVEEARYLHLMERNDQATTKYGLANICPNIVTDHSHTIQTHLITLTMFDRVSLLQQEALLNNSLLNDKSPAIIHNLDVLLTPPASSRKPEENDDNKNHATIIPLHECEDIDQ